MSKSLNQTQTPLLPPPAPMLKRLSAALLDGLFQIILIVPLVFLILWLLYPDVFDRTNDPEPLEYLPLCLSVLLLVLGYYVVGGCIFHGNTPGKQILGLRVLKLPQLKPLTFVDIVFRSVMFMLFCYIRPVFWLNCLWTCFRKQHRSLHDLCCRTYVTNRETAEQVGDTVRTVVQPEGSEKSADRSE